MNYPPSGDLCSALKTLKFLTIDSLYKFETAKFIHLWQNNKLPADFNDFMERINHSYGTRANSLHHLKLAQPKTELGKTSIRFQGAKLWNNIPYHLQMEWVTKKFNENFKTYLLDNQSNIDTS